ncbi:MAG: TetR/AcrR family transcriptional regulator [Caldiserica bacterium]|jgi:AcrR family transcriptional regulator|nr:TetR/AcrR family transcriptional regulator [Caldisericota bacterium]MDH7562635.1 TetR/AcrR family transcriptional regulator [Caldisericota bacterium]
MRNSEGEKKQNKNLKVQKGEETRALLLNVSQNLFSRKGYEEVSVEEICRQAGVSKGGFYHHFSSKEELFLELLDRWLSKLDEELLNIESQAKTVEEAISLMTDFAGYVMEQAEGSYGILFEFWNKARNDEKIWKGAVSYFDRYRKFFRGILEKGIQKGEFPPFDLDLFSQMMVSLAVGVFLESALNPSERNWKSSLKEMIAIILSHFKKERT